MNRLLYLPGLGNAQSGADRVADRLASYYGFEASDGITFGNALADPDKVRKAAKRADKVITGSAGLLAMVGVTTKEIHAINPPLPSTRWRLAGQTVLRGWRERDINHINGPLRVDGGFFEEVKADPWRHLGPFLDGRISRFDAIQAAIDAVRAGVPVGLGFTNRDCYFHPTPERVELARANSVLVALIEGVHDELALRPEATMDAYLAERH
jgi:hypothetical protein